MTGALEELADWLVLRERDLGRDGIDRGLLETGLLCFGRATAFGLVGQRRTSAERPGPQN
jgi:hypothetical protein